MAIIRIGNLIKSANVNGYIIFCNDSHQSEYVHDRDKRIQFISGFKGENASGIKLQ